MRLIETAFVVLTDTISVATGGGGATGGNCPPPTVIRSTPEIRANPKSLGRG